MSNKTLRLKTLRFMQKEHLFVINLYLPYAMYPQLEEVHNLVRKTAKDFVEKRVEPNARRIDQGWYPRELLREMGVAEKYEA
jgi:alkylation response protein AidB-like acyl-CoA dehydrogenase